MTPDAIVAFLSDPRTYGSPMREVIARETHMSWVFLVGDRVYKLKKPLRSDFVDFSTCARRKSACLAEFRLNRRLAKQTYLDVTPLTWSRNGFAIGGAGEIVDWLVVMRRLDERLMLETAILEGRLTGCDLDRLACTLVKFYRHAEPISQTPEQHVAEWKRGLVYNRRVLLRPALGLPAGLIRRIDSLQGCFLEEHRRRLVARGPARRIVDAHGDLRPEHIWLGEPLQIIDCLEFSSRLRALDVLAELAFLDLECERLGATWAGKRIRHGVFSRLPGLQDETLFHFYRSYSAMVRARLAIAHFLDANPRSPGKWRPQALAYLKLAFADTLRLSRLLRRAKRSIPHAADGWSR